MNTEDKVEAEKWKRAQEQARKTATWARTMTKVIIGQNNGEAPFWHVINFLGPGKCEPRGVVDLLAIRKNQGEHVMPLKRGDLFDIILVQVKGGSAKAPTADDRERLRAVARAYDAQMVLLSEWKIGSQAMLRRLDGDAWSDPIDPSHVFGKKKSARRKAAAPKTSKVAGPSPAAKAWATRGARPQ